MKLSFRKFNWYLLIPAFLLTLFGLISIYSIDLGNNDFLAFKKQIIFFVFSLLLMFLFSSIDFRFLKTNSRFVLALYFLSLLLLIGLIFFGTMSRGVRGWYRIGPFSLDPIPFAAIILIIILSKYFSTRHVETKRLKPILFSGLYMAIPVLFVLLQPDLGSSLILICVWLGIIIFSGIKLKHFIILGLISVILLVLAWGFWLQDYQKQRIMSFLKPDIDPQGISWNLNQSKIAIGSGGLLGKGITKGSQGQYGFLPESRTDFIFSSIAEETGFIGIFFLIIIIAFLFYQIIKVSFTASNNFTRLFAAGFSFLFLSQAVINMGMVLGLLPVIGIPLPFVSYGGSHLLAFYLGLGILQSLSKA